MNGPNNIGPKRRDKPLTGRAVLVWFLSFFGIVVGVNLVMAYLAVSTFSGVETDDAYRKGRDYNETLSQRRTQKALGWSLELDTIAGVDGEVRLSVIATDSEGLPIENMSVEATFWRPAASGIDQVQVLMAVGGGHYAGTFTLPAAGNWQIRIEAVSPNGDAFRKVEQVFIKP